MRTNIVLDEDLIQQAMQYSSARSKRALVEEALRTFVRVKEDEKKRLSYRDRVSRIRSQVAGMRLRDSAHEIVRRDRDRR